MAAAAVGRQPHRPSCTVVLGLLLAAASVAGAEFITWEDLTMPAVAGLRGTPGDVKSAAGGGGASTMSTIVVSQDGTGHSRTVQGAVDMVPTGNSRRVKILVRPGVYREKVTVPITKPFVSLIGMGTGRTVITWSAAGVGHRPGVGAPGRHLLLRLLRRRGRLLLRQPHHIRELGAGGSAGGGGAAGGGAAAVRRQDHAVPVQDTGRPGHAVRQHREALLVQLRHPGLHRFHLRECEVPVPGMRAARGGDELRRDRGVAAELGDGGVRVLVRGVQADGLRHDVPGEGVGEVRPGGVRLVRPRRHRGAPGLERLGRPRQDQDGGVRGVQVQGARGEVGAAGAVVAGAHLRGGAPLPRPGLHQRRPVAQIVDRRCEPVEELAHRSISIEVVQIVFSSLQIMYLVVAART